jgi:K+-transporting ATPase KdpF subunit
VELQMSGMYVIGGVVSCALLVYLFVALLKPELFS